MSLALRKLPQCFTIADTKKGDCKEYQDYNGSMSSKEMWKSNGMSDEERKNFKEWLLQNEMSDGVTIHHARNGKEVGVGNFLVNAYCQQTDTIFEFYDVFGMDVLTAMECRPTPEIVLVWESIMTKHMTDWNSYRIWRTMLG